MALRACRECRAQISTGAKSCPHCGVSGELTTGDKSYVKGGVVPLLIVLIFTACVFAGVELNQWWSADVRTTKKDNVATKPDAPTDCDLYAATEFDPGAMSRASQQSAGVPYQKLDYSLAIPACQQAMQQHPETVRFIYQLGRALLRAGDSHASFNQFKIAAERGYAPAQSALGVMYVNGEGVTVDESQAVFWYRKAAEQGYPLAQNNLGELYGKGTDGQQPDYAEAMRWFRKAADQGYQKALYNIGTLYANGLGVSKDQRQALEFYYQVATNLSFYKEAAELGSNLASGGLRKKWSNDTDDDSETMTLPSDEVPECNSAIAKDMAKGAMEGGPLAKIINITVFKIQDMKEIRYDAKNKKRSCRATVFGNVGRHEFNYTLEWANENDGTVWIEIRDFD